MRVQIGSMNFISGVAMFEKDKPLVNEVFQVAILDHPAATHGVPKIVGTTGKQGNLCLIRENGLADCEIPIVLQAVKEWQAT